MGCIPAALIPLAMLLLVFIGARWVLSAIAGTIMHPAEKIIELGCAIAFVLFLIHIAPQAAEWIGSKINRKKT